MTDGASPLFRPSGDAEAGAALLRLAEICDGTYRPSRDLDIRIALATVPGLAQLAKIAPGVWAQGDGIQIRAPRYTASSAAAISLVPDGYWIGCNPRAAGRIEVYGPDEDGAVGWGRNDHFPLAASAAALRTRAALLARPDQMPGRSSPCSRAQSIASG